jgi:hypothetical protein
MTRDLWSSDGVDALPDPMQPALPLPVVDRISAQPEGAQLRPRDHAMLPGCQREHGLQGDLLSFPVYRPEKTAILLLATSLAA